MKKVKGLIFLVISSIFFNACTGTNIPEKSISIDNQTPDFQNGAKDGCQTAKGEYVKDHESFVNNSQYQNGWFYGRKKCNPADAKK